MEAHERLRMARNALELHQKDMAKGIGVSQASWTAYESGKTSFLKLIYKLESVFGINRGWLLNGTEPMFLDQNQKPMDVKIYTGSYSQHQINTVDERKSEYSSEIEILKVKLESLQAQLEQKDQQIADLRRMIDLLTKTP